VGLVWPSFFALVKSLRFILCLSRTSIILGLSSRFASTSLLYKGFRWVIFDDGVAFRRSRGSHMETNSEEKEALKDVSTCSPTVHP